MAQPSLRLLRAGLVYLIDFLLAKALPWHHQGISLQLPAASIYIGKIAQFQQQHTYTQNQFRAKLGKL
jgi:hypothetical protein